MEWDQSKLAKLGMDSNWQFVWINGMEIGQVHISKEFSGISRISVNWLKLCQLYRKNFSDASPLQSELVSVVFYDALWHV
jgi:hypothetical protein